MRSTAPMITLPDGFKEVMLEREGYLIVTERAPTKSQVKRLKLALQTCYLIGKDRRDLAKAAHKAKMAKP